MEDDWSAQSRKGIKSVLKCELTDNMYRKFGLYDRGNNSSRNGTDREKKSTIYQFGLVRIEYIIPISFRKFLRDGQLLRERKSMWIIGKN